VRERHLDPADGYEPLVGRFVTMLADTRRRLVRDLEDFDHGDLDRTPDWAPNSIGTLLYHIAAIELDWTFADLRETDEFPPGTEEWFPVKVREENGRLAPIVDSFGRHLERLDWVRQHLLSTLAGMSDTDLDRTFLNPGEEGGRGGAWIIQHLMQHEVEHRGQIGELRAALRQA
jgi:uncharacterized damage-inducible protein DinB